MIRNTPIFLWVAMFASEACATTGWDAYSVDIRGQYRIHGADCFNYIHKIGPEGRVLEPPLWTNYKKRAVPKRLDCPPDYAVTDTGLHLRYAEQFSKTEKISAQLI